MEDYRRAYAERLADKDYLVAHDRRLATMHFGGVAIECLLKAIIVHNLGIQEWSRQRVPSPGCCRNPGHDLMAAIRSVPRLYQRFMAASVELPQHLHFIAAPGRSYIELRYQCVSPDDSDFEKWTDSFDKVRNWLDAQNQDLLRRR